MRLNAKQIAACTGGSFIVEPMDPRRLALRLTWDSRETVEDDLYVALPGERVDGHDYVAAAVRAGAAIALVSTRPDEATCLLAREMGAALVEVPNTAAAITDIAREWRLHVQGRVIGLTGSSGKTTTKNLVRDVLAYRHAVVATEGNQNNELGVPRTLLSADPETEAVIVEMGMRGFGQISELCDFVRPDWGVVTNVGESHIELLGSREGIAQAKSELLAALPDGCGVAFVNGADDMSDTMLEAADAGKRRIETVCFDGSGRFAASGTCLDDWRQRPAIWAENVRLDAQGCPHFSLCARGFVEGWPPNEGDLVVERCDCSLVLRGEHNVANACAAAAVGRRFGMSLEDIACALAQSQPESGRQEVIAARGGFTVINDAYNANPDSMRASLVMFGAFDVPGSRIAVLGDMMELGDFSQACHEGIGRLAATLPIDVLICMGDWSRYIASAACAEGMDPAKVVCASTTSEVLGELDIRVHPGDAVLVKASHSMGLLRVVEGLIN